MIQNHCKPQRHYFFFKAITTMRQSPDTKCVFAEQYHLTQPSQHVISEKPKQNLKKKTDPSSMDIPIQRGKS